MSLDQFLPSFLLFWGAYSSFTNIDTFTSFSLHFFRLFGGRWRWPYKMEEPPLGCFVLFVISGEFLLSIPRFPTLTTSSIFTNLFASVLKSFHHTWSFFSQKLIKYLMKNTKEFSHKVKCCIKPVSHKEYLPHFGNFRPLKRYKGLGD